VGAIQIQGLPYAATSVANARGAGSVGVTPSGITVNAGYTGLELVIDPGNNYIYLVETTTASYSHTPGVDASGTLYGILATYKVD